MRDLLTGWALDARERTLRLAAALDHSHLLGPRLPIVNPPLWELGHLAWFQERWVLRRAHGLPSLRPDADALYDSIAIPHDTRWELPLPGLPETLAYLREVLERVLALVARGEADPYFVRLSTFHEDMHWEAMAFTRQTLGYAPPWEAADAPADRAGGLAGDVEVPGGTFMLGAREGTGFVFDNEKWAHAVELRAVPHRAGPGDAGAVRRVRRGRRLPPARAVERGRLALARGGRGHQPVYWDHDGAGWRRRDFDRWVPLEPDGPWCTSAGSRRTPGAGGPGGASPPRRSGRRPPRASRAGREARARKRRFPWGDAAPTPARAHLDARGAARVDVGGAAGGRQRRSAAGS